MHRVPHVGPRDGIAAIYAVVDGLDSPLPSQFLSRVCILLVYVPFTGGILNHLEDDEDMTFHLTRVGETNCF